MRHPKSLAVSYKLLIINNSILSRQKSDEVGTQITLGFFLVFQILYIIQVPKVCHSLLSEDKKR